MYLIKKENEYMISPLWVERANEFTSKLADAYEKSDLSRARKLQELNFSSWG